MKLFKKHMERVYKIKDYAAKNKIFTLAAVVIVVILIINAVNSDSEPTQPPEAIPDTSEESTTNGKIGEVGEVDVPGFIRKWRLWWLIMPVAVKTNPSISDNMMI
ncbi:MAG: hypothetical protein FWG45_07725 [Oscillospiraceae bacterium]|nr:hypothetical protein [Oscillospiraceae bacterium]